MKKFILTAAVGLSFLGYIFYSKQPDEGVVIPPPSLQNIPVSQSGSSSSSAGSGSSPNPAAAQSSTASSVSRTTGSVSQTTGKYKDGQYTGSAADAYYGTVQVKAIIKGGKIADVQFLQYPNDRSNSVEINSQAMPYLTAEAIQVQSANVDIVSGATDTSQAFQQSLQDALSQAV